MNSKNKYRTINKKLKGELAFIKNELSHQLDSEQGKQIIYLKKEIEEKDNELIKSKKQIGELRMRIRELSINDIFKDEQ